MAATLVPRDPKRDIVAYELVRTTPGYFQLWIGEAPIIADSAPSLVAAIDIYSLCALTATGVTPFVVGTHTKDQMVINSVKVEAIGQATPYWDAGKFNHEAINWPAGATLDTYEERKAFMTGTMLRVGHTI